MILWKIYKISLILNLKLIIFGDCITKQLGNRMEKLGQAYLKYYFENYLDIVIGEM